MKIVFLVWALILTSTHAFAKSAGRHEVGLQTGPFLVAKATENLATIGGRISLALNSNHIKHLELRGFGANSGGTSYYLGEISIRNEFTVEKMSAVWLFGFDWHYLRSPNAEEFKLKQGWHAGCGLNIQIGNNLMFRNDYIVRLAGGMSLSVNLGLSWAFGDAGKKK